jgi:hypothetical protein
MCVEDHGAGRQLLRFRIWPWPRPAAAWLLGIGPALLALIAALAGAWLAAGVLGAIAVLFSLRVARQSGAAMALVLEKLSAGPRRELVLLQGQRRPVRRVPRQQARRAGGAA